jgi:hypothetical protein
MREAGGAPACGARDVALAYLAAPRVCQLMLPCVRLCSLLPSILEETAAEYKHEPIVHALG